jgi:hypothetical protein
MMGLATLTQDACSFLRHRKTAGLIIVVDSEVTRLGFRALNQRQYGALGVKVFDSMSIAFEYLMGLLN